MQKSNPDAPIDLAGYRIDNPGGARRATSCGPTRRPARRCRACWSAPTAKSGPFSAATEMSEATKTMSDIARHWMADPARLMEAQGALMHGYTELWNNTLRRMMGEDVEPVAEPEIGDNRFKDPEWSANPYFDFWKQAYLLTSHWAEDMLEQDRGPRRAHQAQGRVPSAADLERAVAVEFSLHQPRGAARDARHQRQEPRAGDDEPRARHGALGRSAEDHPDRRERLRGRPQPRRHARQGRVPERSAAADPVHADDGQGARGAAADRAAVDQQVLHPRPDGAEELHQVSGRPGLHDLRRLLGQSRRDARRTRPSRTT